MNVERHRSAGVTSNLELLAQARYAAPAGHYSGFSIGGVSVEVGGSSSDVALAPSLRPFQFEAERSDIAVQVEWVRRLCPESGRPLFDSGAVWQLYEDESGFRFDFSAPALGERPYKRLLVDTHFRRATLQMNEACLAGLDAGSPLEYPLDELLIMHRLTQERAIELHSCGIVTPGGTGNLFVGHSEAGKTTTTRLWMEHEGTEVLSDDRIIVREHGGQMVMYGTPWHGEAAFASPASAPLKRIFILEQGLGNKLYRLSPLQAVSELFARSFVPFYEPKYVDAALDYLQALTESVPCYRYVFEPNQAAVERVLNFSD
jgi:hypothetical protein